MPETKKSIDPNYVKYVKERRVFILGAGFSAAAGIPMTGELLQAAMEKCKKECPGFYERICGYTQAYFDLEDSEPDYTNLSFPEIATYLHYIELREYGGGERWNNNGSKENLALRFYLSKTICELTPSIENIPDLYIKFAEQLTAGDIILTFNWDCLLELCLEKAGQEYSYLQEDNKITIVKLHGSINWRLDKDEETDYQLNVRFITLLGKRI
ncbi:MAG: hypothetical protein PQ612_00250 [Rickettsiales bacterium]|nr:hypothetical protein [Pseudomonadota bacterium]MDA0965653.1 hypothetical protein [Pseudomonadota bacterium]MDG4542977.1 hypothetical protein [Rickettsiales bacterium]MDG4544575.1 hypothetical protein [Rickettsiales bacterium]MDG4546697.1 hypothetical protein [Rickettsiales bacterium]